MDVFEAICERRSIRAFAGRPVGDADVWRILEAVNAAPSAGNLQAYEIYWVRAETARWALARAAHDQEFVAQAPVVLVFCAHAARSGRRYGRRGETLYAVQDATIAATFAMLAAVALGLGSVWVGAFDEEQVRSVIGAPAGLRPVAILPIGYPAEHPPATPRRSLKEIVHEVA